jgi:hypothetical protein
MTGKRSPMARPGNQNALEHGARSPRQIAAKARAHRRRVLRNLGLKAGDLDGIGREFLRLWSQGQAELDLRTAGGVDSGRDFWVCYANCRRALERLTPYLEAAAKTKAGAGSDLDKYLSEHYGEGKEPS